MSRLSRTAALGFALGAFLTPTTANTAMATEYPCYFACYVCVQEPCCQPEPPLFKTIRDALSIPDCGAPPES